MDERDMRSYHNVRLVGFDQDGMDRGLQLVLRFQTREQQMTPWEASPGLIFGNLVCLSPGGRFQQGWF